MRYSTDTVAFVMRHISAAVPGPDSVDRVASDYSNVLSFKPDLAEHWTGFLRAMLTEMQLSGLESRLNSCVQAIVPDGVGLRIVCPAADAFIQPIIAAFEAHSHRIGAAYA